MPPAPSIEQLYDNPIWKVIETYVLPPLMPYLLTAYSWANTIGAILVIYYFSVYWRARLKKADLEKQIEDALDKNFDWMKEVEANRKSEDPRWKRIDTLTQSTNANDWRIALIEADAVMDELIKNMGFPGENMGERMKGMVKSDFPLLDSAWEVHRLRNTLAHETGYQLTKTEMDKAMDTYHRIFKDLGFIKT